MADLLFGPVPHEDASDFIKSKPAVSRAVFDGLLPELRARAFCVTGIEDVNVLQRVRDTVAKLPQGARWDDAKKEIAGQISPYLVDDDAAPEEKDRQIVSATRRAELLLRTHGFQAYQSAAFDVAERQKDTHPYWQYMSMEDGAVRPSHAALDGVILPADSAFWKDHTPPWDWGCRCQFVPISQDDHDDAKKIDAKRSADDAMVLSDAQQLELEQNGRLVRGPNQIVNCKSPVAMGKPNAFQWHPGDLRLTPEQLSARYDADIWDKFESWAKGTKIDAGRNVWEWMNGAKAPPAPPGKQLAIVPKPKAPPAPAPAPAKPATVAALLKQVGLDTAAPATPAQMNALRKVLVEKSPVKAALLNNVISIDKPAAYRTITSALLREVTQGFVDMLPPDVAKQLVAHRFRLEVHQDLQGALGDYNEATHVMRLNGGRLDGDKAALKTTLWHEMTHWLHDHGPAEHRARIEALFAARTKNFTDAKVKLKPFNSSKIMGFDDDFRDANGDEYAGRIYPWETGNPRGYEIATRHLEKLAVSSAELAAHWNFKSPKTGKFAWREAFKECLHLFYSPAAPAAPSTP